MIQNGVDLELASSFNLIYSSFVLIVLTYQALDCALRVLSRRVLYGDKACIEVLPAHR